MFPVCGVSGLQCYHYKATPVRHLENILKSQMCRCKPSSDVTDQFEYLNSRIPKIRTEISSCGSIPTQRRLFSKHYIPKSRWNLSLKTCQHKPHPQGGGRKRLLCIPQQWALWTRFLWRFMERDAGKHHRGCFHHWIHCNNPVSSFKGV